jgi:hypothetical protein
LPILAEVLPHYVETGSVPGDPELLELMEMTAEELEAIIPTRPPQDRALMAEGVAVVREIVRETRSVKRAESGA